jgi:hypothetical protein
MKNTIKVFGIIALVAVIGFAMTACDNEDGEDKFIVNETSGRLTITGIPVQYNGKWIAGYGSNYPDILYAGSGFADNGTADDWPVKGVQIAGGTATLKVWKYRREVQDKGGYVSVYRDNYTGNDSGVLFNIEIHETETQVGGSTDIAESVTVNFASGAFVQNP